jgi:predicted RNase H-like HicB family nuclease
MSVNICHVAYEQDDSGWWVASIREVRGCHSQGRTIDKARRRVHEALGLFIEDDAESAEFVDDLPA